MSWGRIALLLAALAAWIAGATLGTPAVSTAGAQPLFQLTKVRASFTPILDGDQPIFILFLGSDARPGEPVDGERSDSIHLMGINPAKHRVSILGFPRDSWVEIPGHGMDKINSAMVYGGPELTVKTVESITGIKIDYYALTSFQGFHDMVNGVGGIVVDVPFPMYDPGGSGTKFSKAGPQRVNGQEALAFSRDRHSITSGDFGRSENQGRVFEGALRQFRKEFMKNPSRLLTWVGAGLRNIFTTNVPLDDVMTLAFTATSIKPERVQNMVVPATTGSQGGQSVVYIADAAKTIYADMKDDGIVSPGHVPPSYLT